MADSGKVRWEYTTGGAILASPTLWENRLYIGSADGYVYCLEASTGRPLWRFLATPLRRKIMMYGALCDTWPVNSGVLITPADTDPLHPRRALACFAAGITSLDGAHVWAVDARTGQMVWHQTGDIQGDAVSKDTLEGRIGVCCAGALTAESHHLWMAGGGWVGRVSFDLADGKMAPMDYSGGWANRNPGADIGIFADRFVYLGGNLLFRDQNERRSTALGFLALNENSEAQYPESTLTSSLFSPVWDAQTMVIETRNRANDHDSLLCLDAKQLLTQFDGVTRKPLAKWYWERPQAESKDPSTLPSPMKIWNWDPNRHCYGIMLAANAVIVLSEAPWKVRLPAQADRSWSVSALDRTDGRPIWEVKLPGEPIFSGSCLDREGRVIVTLTDGSLVSVGEK